MRQELIDGVKAGGFAGLATAAVIFVLYLGLQVLTLIGGESVDIFRFLAFTVSLAAGLTALGVIPGALGSVFYASLREKLDRHDLAFAASLSVLVVGVAANFGIQFLVLFVPTAVYIIALEKLYDRR